MYEYNRGLSPRKGNVAPTYLSNKALIDQQQKANQKEKENNTTKTSFRTNTNQSWPFLDHASQNRPSGLHTTK